MGGTWRCNTPLPHLPPQGGKGRTELGGGGAAGWGKEQSELGAGRAALPYAACAATSAATFRKRSTLAGSVSQAVTRRIMLGSPAQS